MKLTKSLLQQIIKEEIENSFRDNSIVVETPEGIKLPNADQKQITLQKWMEGHSEEIGEFIRDKYIGPFLMHNGEEPLDDYDGPDRRLRFVYNTMEILGFAADSSEPLEQNRKKSVLRLPSKAKDEAEKALLEDFVSFAEMYDDVRVFNMGNPKYSRRKKGDSWW